MKRFISLLLTLALCFVVTACGSSAPDKQPAVNAFNNASSAYDALVDKINPNIDAYDAEFIDLMEQMGSALTEHKEILESDQELTEEQIAEMVKIFGQVESWAKDTDAQLDSLITETETETAGDKQSVIDLFNKVSADFNAMASKINANIGDYDQQVIDVMTQMANALNECQSFLSGDGELSDEVVAALTQNLTDIESWVAEADRFFNGGSADKQTAIDTFNATSEMFNAIAVEVNSHIEDFPQELVDGMTQMAEGLSAYQAVLASGTELTQEQIDELMEACGLVQQWAQEVEGDIFG